ncbi:hypothetical protein EYF80_049775 [Liparis tanakae]|uniref:Uncharacterized protein n=1 Tax=Liparis tanakae TaxID=230148 RepID=A0A4Z2FGI4_9TELE|nr:hypothetical protein EYF80_049775 [Liparis tanakae]
MKRYPPKRGFVYTHSESEPSPAAEYSHDGRRRSCSEEADDVIVEPASTNDARRSGRPIARDKKSSFCVAPPTNSLFWKCKPMEADGSLDDPVDHDGFQYDYSSNV